MGDGDRLATLFFLLTFFVVAQSQDSCYTDHPHHPFYTTETVYREGRKLLQGRLEKHDHRISGCRPRYLQLFVRHGTRYPSAKDIGRARDVLYLLRDNITFNYNDGKTRMCGEDLKLLRHWNLTYNESMAKNLAPRGEREMRAIAEAFETNFQYLLRHTTKAEDYEFVHTKTSRTKMSAKNFAMELFGTTQAFKFKNNGQNDPVLRPYRSCPRWTQTVLNNPSAHSEVEKFKRSRPFVTMVNDISRRFGFHKDPLPVDTILLVYSICRFEYGVNEGLSPWCVTFTPRDINTLEYLYDLEYWWLHGYGHKINTDQTCATLQKIVKNFEDVSSKVNETSPIVPRAVFSFSHSKFMLRLFTTFGLFKDGDSDFRMTADDFGPNKKWRLSAIDPVATNLAIVLYTCNDGGQKVMFYVQETPIKLPGCSNIACDLKEFLGKFKPIAQSCDFGKICAPISSQASTSKGSQIFLINIEIIIIFISILTFIC